jgi:hypothetical protein
VVHWHTVSLRAQPLAWIAVVKHESYRAVVRRSTSSIGTEPEPTEHWGRPVVSCAKATDATERTRETTESFILMDGIE